MTGCLGGHGQVHPEKEQDELLLTFAMEIGQHAEDCPWEDCSESEKDAAYRSARFLLTEARQHYHPLLLKEYERGLADGKAMALPTPGSDEKMRGAIKEALKNNEGYSIPADVVATERLLTLFQSTQAEAVSLLKELTDPDDCNLDHHGYCQTHGWLQEGLCPHFRAKIYLQALTNEGE